MFLLNTVCANILIIIKNTIFANNIFVMTISGLGKTSMKVGNAVESLAKTDDMLAIIGVIMLLGVVFSAYGSLWQGLLASKQYKEECSPNIIQKESNSKKIAIALIGGVLLGALVIFLIFKTKSKKQNLLTLA